jgi:hypothetical protein
VNQAEANKALAGEAALFNAGSLQDSIVAKLGDHRGEWLIGFLESQGVCKETIMWTLMTAFKLAVERGWAELRVVNYDDDDDDAEDAICFREPIYEESDLEVFNDVEGEGLLGVKLVDKTWTR